MSLPLLRTFPCEHCYICDSEGIWLYQGLTDYLFDVPGQWQLKICTNPTCQLVWLDPMPVQEDLIKAYHNYYTRSRDKLSSSGFIYRLDRALHRRINWLLAVLTDMRTQQTTYRASLFLQDRTPGKLLDVGCGNGRWLARMRDLGWQVEGIDFDSEAAQQARTQYGLIVHVGELSTVGYPDNHFDAIILQHVIEHLPHPVSVLAECRRILKPNGRLVVITPNIQSWGHQHFGHHWRGLEPPRHLYLFSRQTLSRVAQQGGFNQIETFTTAVGAESILANSQKLKNLSQQQAPMKFKLLSSAWLLQYYELWLLRRHPELGEEVVLLAQSD
ncbi:MAG: class I SAM-dependent methyltransferase [Candidatus Parabeggiatoa sp. nov. 2]|nr:MAG: class I SAM-dependent methyltransferase [Gammaproteobacteria bacterium]